MQRSSPLDTLRPLRIFLAPTVYSGPFDPSPIVLFYFICPDPLASMQVRDKGNRNVREFDLIVPFGDVQILLPKLWPHFSGVQYVT